MPNQFPGMMYQKIPDMNLNPGDRNYSSWGKYQLAR